MTVLTVRTRSRSEFYAKIVVSIVLYLMAIALILVDYLFQLNIKPEYITLIAGSLVSVASVVLKDALTSGKESIYFEKSAGLPVKIVIESEDKG